MFFYLGALLPKVKKIAAVTPVETSNHDRRRAHDAQNTDGYAARCEAHDRLFLEWGYAMLLGIKQLDTVHCFSCRFKSARSWGATCISGGYD